MSIAVIRFPATNNELEMVEVLNKKLLTKAELIPHYNLKKIYSKELTGIIIPGGFSYGDYLRPGAIASVTEIMKVIKFRNIEDGIPILGICNGFQILSEAGMLPGVLTKNLNSKFISKWVFIKPYNENNNLLKDVADSPLRMPIAHFEGRYWIDDASLEKLTEKSQILFQYCDSNNNVDSQSNPNGSVMNIAGVSNEDFSVFGLMPHPERASNHLLGSSDGLQLLEAFVKLCEIRKVTSISSLR